MRPTINLFKDCLRNPAAHLSKLVDAEFKCDKNNNPMVWRNTHFAEAEVTMNGKRYIVGMPLTNDAHVCCLRRVTLINKFTSPYLAYSEILIDEMTFTDRRGEVVSVDLLLHEIPAGGTLYEFAEYASRAKLLKAIDALESEFKSLGLVHNNLTPHNVILDENYNIYVFRFHYTEAATIDKDCSEEFAALRKWVDTTVNIDNGEGDISALQNGLVSSSLFDGYEYVSNPFEELICVADERGYLYVDCDNKVMIEGRFKWASDFHEGRAEVETESGMGLIDKKGNYILQPKYEIVDYDVESGLSRVRLNNEWAVYTYTGEQKLPFEPRYIDDEDLELLSI